MYMYTVCNCIVKCTTGVTNTSGKSWAQSCSSSLCVIQRAFVFLMLWLTFVVGTLIL